MVIKLGLSH